MKNATRTSAGLRNSSVTIVCQILRLATNFVSRTVLSKLLGMEYLGINGLFTNILMVLAFADLGIGSALVYRMYAPFSRSDKAEIVQYVRIYQVAYRIIAAAITVFGLAMIPLLPFLVKAPDVKENVVTLYILYLGQTVVSYIWVYKASVFIADQKTYIVNICAEVFNILMNAAQCAFLLLTHNFIAFCIVRIVCTLLSNLTCSILADRAYPFLKDMKSVSIEGIKLRHLAEDVRGLLMSKVAGVAFSGTDNMFISAFLGIRYVGILSNYTLILSTINVIMNKVFDSMTASIGNLAVQSEAERVEGVLKKLFFFNAALYSWICLELWLLLREFVTEVWLSPDFFLRKSLIALVLLELLLRGMHYPMTMVRSAFGLFSQYKHLHVLAAVLNIVLDFLLVRPLNMEGLYIATILCRGITSAVDVCVVYSLAFKKSIRSYYQNLLKWLTFAVVLAAGFQCLPLSGVGFGLRALVLKGALITPLYALALWGVFGRTEEFRYYLNMARNLIAKARTR